MYILHSIQVNCVWGEWTSWSDCTRTCATGVKSKQRWKKITALYGGHECSGARTKSEKCNTQTCPGGSKLDKSEKGKTC